MFLHKKFVRPVEIINFNESVLCPVDQFDSQDFNINECGFIRNDISKLVRAASQTEHNEV